MNAHELFLDFMPAISVVFKLGFIPSEDEIYELTDEQYDSYKQQGGDVAKRLYTIIPKNYKYLTQTSEVGLLTGPDASVLMKAAEFLRGYAKKEGCVSDRSDDILAFAAERFPSYFSEGTKFAKPHLKLLRPGETPPTPQVEWLSLISNVLGGDKALTVKIAAKEEKLTGKAHEPPKAFVPHPNIFCSKGEPPMKIYNTLTREKEDFVPLDENEVKIYVCGPTVYNFFHIGNARPFVVFDTLRKYMEYKGYNVNFVQNFTDVDDKIINRAKEEGASASEVSEKYIGEYYKDAAALNIRKATAHPKVTENMDEIVGFVRGLVGKGFAYETGGDVYYSTRQFDGYGKLSKQRIEDLEIGARIEASEKKKDPLDFALWKARKADDEIAWDSPWGMGRPGWHIECSAMSRKYLAETIDIHAGGQDLIFPHHENEIAQSEAENGKPFAKYWMHNGYITIDDEKMSKSKGNFFMVRDILKDFSGEAIRFFLLSGHYRSPLNFSDALMEQAKSGLARLQNAKSNLKHLVQTGSGEMTAGEKTEYEKFGLHKDSFVSAMDDDLNTADAVSAVFELVTAINTAVKDGASKGFAEKSLELLQSLTDVLGLLQDEADESVDGEIAALIEERQRARKEKNFARADEIRDLLKERGITLKDTPQGVQIVREP